MLARTAFAAALALGLAAAAPADAASIKVMTYNTYHGGTVTGTTDGQLDTIAAQNPDVVVLQETFANQLSYYVDGLNSRLHTSAWHGVIAKHCLAGTNPTCTSYSDDGVMLVTRLHTVASNWTEIWAKDDYRVARAVIRMEVTLSDGTTANVFVVHLPALNDAATSRNVFVTAFKAWAAGFAGPQLVGGDFNAHPGTTPILEMQQAYTEEWAAGGSGSGYTHANPSVSTRIDYWFGSSKTSLTSISVPADTKDSDHRPVVATFNVSGGTSAPAPPPTPTGESTVMSDAFSSLNRTYWPYGVFTGTQDTSIGLAASGGLKIGALKSGMSDSHYNGISTKAYDLSSNGSAYAQLVTAPNTATTAYAMFAVGSDGNNFYRWYESGNALVAEKRIAGTKTELVNLPYSATAHQFLRIRREYNSSTGLNEVVFDTAPNNSGVPGTWTERHREAWNTSVNASALRCELKAGTSDAVVSPGTVTWDNFRAAINTP